MASIYEISEDILSLMDMLYDDEEDVQVVLDTIESLEYDFEIKADNYAKLIKSMLADANAIKEEEKRLAARRNTLEVRVNSLKGMLEYNMRALGKTKFKTTMFSFGIQKNGGLQPLTIPNVKDIPKEYMIPQDPIPNNEAIRELLSKQNVSWARLEPRGESLRIR